MPTRYGILQAREIDEAGEHPAVDDADRTEMEAPVKGRYELEW